MSSLTPRSQMAHRSSSPLLSNSKLSRFLGSNGSSSFSSWQNFPNSSSRSSILVTSSRAFSIPSVSLWSRPLLNSSTLPRPSRSNMTNWAVPFLPCRAVRPTFCNSTRKLSGRKVTQTCIPPFDSTFADVIMSVPRPAIFVAIMISPESIDFFSNLPWPVYVKSLPWSDWFVFCLKRDSKCFTSTTYLQIISTALLIEYN